MDQPLKKKACDRCYRHKKVCDGGPPCDGCKNASTECTFVRNLPKPGRPRTASHIIRKKTYSHGACAECKSKKKKCNENWPSCSNCEKSGLICSGPKKKKDSRANPSIQPKPLPQEHEIEMETAGDNFSNEGFEALDFLADISPSFSSFFSKPELELSKVSDDLFSEGILGSLSNKEKIFLNSLIKSPNFPLEFRSSPGSDLAVSERTEEDTQSDDGNILRLCQLNSHRIPAGEMDLVVYFILEVSPLLFVDKASTKFHRTVIPLSLEDENVRYSVLGMSASHRANNPSHSKDAFRRDACIYRAKAQSLFLASNIDYFQDSENTLLSILLICIQEIFEGTSLYWSVALEKAASIIDKRGGLKRMSQVAPLSVQLFCYLDLISSLSTCSSPYVDKNRISDYDETQLESILNSKFGFKFGIEGEIFKIVGNISTLASLRETRYASKAHEQRFNTLANCIEMRLQNWSPSLDRVADKYQIEETTDNGKLVLQSFAISLQWSAFLRLHQIRHGYNRKDSRVEACLAIILRSIKVIENNSDIESGLMFPLIMAGSVAYKKKDRDTIRARIQGIQERLKFNYIGEFKNLLQIVWDRDQYENHSVNWAKIRYFQFSGLVML